MAKNGPNDPIFGPVMYYNGLDQIPKKFRKRAKIGHFLAEKPKNFAFFEFFFRNSILNGKFIEIHPDAPISPIFGLKWSLECQEQKWVSVFGYFEFWRRYLAICGPRWSIFANFCQFLPIFFLLDLDPRLPSYT